MGDVALRHIQAEHGEWLTRNFGNDVESYRPLLGIVEEVGELAHAHLKEVDGIRGTPEQLQSKAKDAVGDIVLFLCGYCTTRGFDVQECVEEAWRIVQQRDWTVERKQP